MNSTSPKGRRAFHTYVRRYLRTCHRYGLLACVLLASVGCGSAHPRTAARGAKELPATTPIRIAPFGDGLRGNATSAVVLGTPDGSQRIALRERPLTLSLPSWSARSQANLVLRISTYTRPPVESSAANTPLARLGLTTVLGVSDLRIEVIRSPVPKSPEASAALIAAAALMALTGRSPSGPRSSPMNASIAGVLNPDGTIGPIRNLPSLIRAGISAKLRRIGVPAGQRHSRDASDAAVDLVALARASQVDLREIDDLVDAVGVLGAGQFPAPRAVSRDLMQLTSEQRKRLSANYRRLRADLHADWLAFAAIRNDASLPPRLSRLATEADLALRGSERLHRGGAYASAYWYLLQAAAWTKTAAAVHTALLAARRGDFATLRARLTDGPHRSAARAILAKAAGGTPEAQPPGFAQQLIHLDALELALRAWQSRATANSSVSPAGAILDGLATTSGEIIASDSRLHARIVDAVLPVLANRALATLMTRAHDDMLLHTSSGVQKQSHRATTIVRLDELTRWTRDAVRELLATASPGQTGAAQLRRSAASMQKLAAALTPPQASAWHRATARYAASQLALHFARRSTWPESALLPYPALIEAEPSSAQMPDERLLVPQLDRQLATAERACRRHARAALVATGSIPLAVRSRYQAANSLIRSALPSLRLRALALFWSASELAQSAVALATPAAPASGASETSGATGTQDKASAAATAAIAENFRHFLLSTSAVNNRDVVFR